MSGLSYMPEPYEQAFYDGIFNAVDTQRTGNIAGGQAVQFFARSKLPIDVLKNIWTVADQPSTGSLNKAKFAVAIRLIQLTQNGQKGQGPGLSSPPGVTLRPPFFEGFPPGGPPPQQQQAPPQGPPGGRPPMPQQQMQAPPQQQQQSSPQQQQFQAPAPGGRPMPQQQMQPPSPQQQMQAPPTPGGRPMQGPPGPGGPPPSYNQGMSPPPSLALVPQDPYTMLPQERARYEGIFPEYAKDGFVYGKEAVELFSKSGMNVAVLRDIWNLVDIPVDNRLDKLEFAMAMHLIVCISKKNLPIPPNGLPMSLKAIKQQDSQQAPLQQPQAPPQQQQQQPPQQQQMRQQQMPSPPMQQQMGGPPQQMQMPSPPMQQQMGGPPQLGGPPQQMQMLSPPMQQQMGGPPQQMQMPSPPLQQQMPASPTYNAIPSPQAQRQSFQSFGSTQPSMQPSYQHAPAPPTISLNPSFENERASGVPPVVSTSGMSISDAFEGLSTTSANDPSTPAFVSAPASHHHDYQTMSAVPESSSVEQEPAPAPQASPPKSTRALASNYDLGNATVELGKLQTVLQKLQAENISLKAQLGSMTEEEKDVQKELGAAVAEIGKLSNELTTLRGQVLAAKSRLMEASGQLKAAREKKGVLKDLINEARDTKDAINDAHTAIEEANEAHEHHLAEQQKNKAVLQHDLFETSLLGFTGPPAPAPAHTNQFISAPQSQTNSYDNFSHDGSEQMASRSIPEPAKPSWTAAPVQNKQPTLVPPITTVDSSDISNKPSGDDDDGQDLFENDLDDAPHYAPQKPSQYNELVKPPSLSAGVQPAPTLNSGHHHRVSSLGFADDFVMGGAASPLAQSSGGLSPPALAASNSSAYGYDDEDAMGNIEKLKRKAERAQETAHDAEAAYRKIMAEADELRQDADKAEATARSLRAAAEETKKGTFGGGKKKKLQKESDKAASDAVAIRNQFKEVQGRANDAQAVAMETKREFEKLRSLAEQAEIDAAQVASMREQERREEQNRRKQAEAQKPKQETNGYSGQQYNAPHNSANGPSYGGLQQGPMSPAQSYGYGGQMDPAQNMYGLNSSSDGGFAAGVMGGGGDKFDLPSPNQFGADEVYSNPFE